VADDGHCRNTAYSLFSVEVDLTGEGLAAGPGFGLAVVALFFEYVAMLRQAGPQKWVWDESRQLNDMRFRCASHLSAMY
jgi:secreted Zn-dependent insulinase-like peptidase